MRESSFLHFAKPTMGFLLLTVALCATALSTTLPAEQRNILTGSTSPTTLSRDIIPLGDWHPFPKASERDQWNTLPEELRNAYIKRGEQSLEYEWPNLPATVYLEFSQNGNRSNYQSIVGRRRRARMNLVLAECVEGKGRFIEQIVNGVWATCEETSWVIPAHLSLQQAKHGLADVDEPTVDLFAAETGASLAWTHYLVGEKLAEVSPLLPTRIITEIDRRILTPNLERDDFWWMGFPDREVNNWNPWINTNWLTCVLLAEQNEERRIAGIHKTMRSIENFLNHYPADGGCDEGPGYWNVAGGRLFDYLEFLRVASNDKLSFYENKLIQEIGRYIAKAHIHESYVANFADARAKANLAGGLVYRYGKQINDPVMMSLGAWSLQRRNPIKRGLSGNISRQLFSIFDLQEMLSAPASQPYLRDAWLPDIQVMFARSNAGSAEGWYVAAKGGHNAESHNHNDVGSFILYKDGLPALIDIGVEEYSRKTFSRDRYDIWTMQSGYHNLPTVNGIDQKAGRTFKANAVHYTSTDEYAQLDQDISSAYPESAGIHKWNRTLRLNRTSGIDLTDSFRLSSDATALTFSFMTPYLPVISESAVRVTGIPKDEKASVSFSINYDPAKVSPSFEEIEIKDRNLNRVWGDKLYRILFTHLTNPSSDTVTFTISE